ncbi:MAG: segregation/condensation protein A [Candidatus Faecisoma sp.]|jgi:segregation and condensation protein A|nr:segregation/condensation protein A [Acholeplasma sp.]MDY2893246.1 segregation/condensation protein A [Candidatus Faecisoma sp.]CCY27615.1 segregation and condensation protein A [Acholeplasma sp. CAG:878]
MEYIVTIDKFQGPLDLLLHLVKQTNLDIYEIKIEEIVSQYFNYIKQMEEMNLNIASSYLVMAAELLEIKALMLLPKDEEIVDEFEENPKDRLIKRLIEYQNYKDLTGEFQELENKRHEYYTKLPSNLSDYDLKINGSLPDNIDLNDLMNAFNKFLERQQLQKPLNTKIANKEYSIFERSLEIKKIIKEKKKVSFEELFDIRNKGYIVVTFLSILNLAKTKEVKIEQENNFETIYLCEVK